MIMVRLRGGCGSFERGPGGGGVGGGGGGANLPHLG